MRDRSGRYSLYLKKCRNTVAGVSRAADSEGRKGCGDHPYSEQISHNKKDGFCYKEMLKQPEKGQVAEIKEVPRGEISDGENTRRNERRDKEIIYS